MTGSEEIQRYAEILRNPNSPIGSEGKRHELIQRGILAVLEEISLGGGEKTGTGQLLYETAGTHPNEAIRRQALQALIRLAQEGQNEAVDFLFLLSVEKDLLAARQAILSHGWEPTRKELRALFHWDTALAGNLPYPVEYLTSLTRAYFSIASPDLQKRLIGTAAEIKMGNWARIVSALQEGSEGTFFLMVKDYPLFSSQERQLLIEELDNQAQLGNQPAQETLCSLFLDHADAEVKQIIQQKGYAPEDPERRALLFFLLEDWPAYNRLDFDHSLMINQYDAAGKPLRRRLMEHSRATGQTEWLRDLGRPGEMRWPNDLSDADWELVIQRLSMGDKQADLWRLAQSAPPLWSAQILTALDRIGWKPASAVDAEGFSILTGMAKDCLAHPLMIQPRKSLYSLSSDITCLAVQPDGAILAAGASDQRISIWNLPGGELSSLSLLVPAPVTRAVALDPAGEMIACSSGDNRIRVFNRHNGQMMKALEGHHAMVRALLIHPNGRLMFSAGFDGDIRFWRFPSGPELKILQPGAGEIFSLVVGGGGQALISGGIDGLARVWAIPDGALVREIQYHTGTITHLAASLTTDLVISAGRDGKICAFNSSSGGLIKTIANQSGPVTSLSLHPNDQVLASGDQNGVITLWSLSSGSIIQQLSKHQASINGIVFHPQDHTLYSSDTAGTLNLWDLRTLIGIRLAERSAHPGTVAELQKRLQDLRLSGPEQSWLTFHLELSRWRQRFDIEISDIQPIQIGTFDIELG